MAARYVFWRNQHGKPESGDGDRCAPAALLAELCRTAKVNAEQSLEWAGILPTRWMPAIRACVAVTDPEGHEVNETDTWSIVRPALVAVIKKHAGTTAIRPRDVLAEADRRAAVHFRTPVGEYVLRTSLSIRSFPAKRINVGDCEIRAMPDHAARRFDRPTTLESSTGHTKSQEECHRAGYSPVLVSTAGRTMHEAVEAAVTALNVLRGIWTLLGTVGTWTIVGGELRPRPVGEIRLGPVHTLHNPNGALVEDVHWSEAAHVTNPRPFDPRRGWARIENDRRWAFGRLGRLPFRPEVERLLARYAEALDHADHDVAFLHLWGILERITETVGAKYEETVRRASWIFSDGPVVEELMDALRLCRNQYVHAARSGDARDQIVYTMKWVVDRHLIAILRNDFRVQSLEEYGRFLALPSDLNKLEQVRRKTARAIAIRKRWMSGDT